MLLDQKTEAFHVQVFVPLGDTAVVAGWAMWRLQRRLNEVMSVWAPWGWLEASLLCTPPSLPSLCPTVGIQDTALRGPDGGCLETRAGNM